MKQSIWDSFAPIYELAMRSQKKQYELLYEKIRAAVGGKSVLELATGPGLIAKNIAESAASVVATDFSEKMILQAKKNKNLPRVTFEVADATNLRYEENSFDTVIIANALHIMPNPQKALSEINRVLKADGILIAPNFVGHSSGKKPNLWAKILKALGVKFEHEWTESTYTAFLEENGWSVRSSCLIKGKIDMLYTECVRK